MKTATPITGPRSQGAIDGHDLAPLVVFGIALGVFAFTVAGIVDGAALVIARSFHNPSASDVLWPVWASVVTAVFAVAVSLLVGCWLYRLRRFVVPRMMDSDPNALARKRRYFVIASMITYSVLAPSLWIFMVLAASNA